MKWDVENKRIGVFSNLQIYKKCAVVRKDYGWIICDIKCNPITSIVWKKVEVAGDYVITADEENRVFLFLLENNMLSPVVNDVSDIKWLGEDYFCVTKNEHKALYKGSQNIIKFDSYNQFVIDFEFGLVRVANMSGKYGVVSLDGYWYINECDEVVFWRNSQFQTIKYLKYGKWGLYRIGQGNIIPSTMDSIEIHLNYIECVIGKLRGAYSFEGEQLVPIRYEIIKPFGNVFKTAQKKGKRYFYGAIDTTGRTIMPCKYSRVNIDIEKGKVEGINFIVHVKKTIADLTDL